MGIYYGAAGYLLLAPRHGESKQCFYDNSEPESHAQGRSQLYLVPHMQHKLDPRLLWSSRLGGIKQLWCVAHLYVYLPVLRNHFGVV